MHHIPVAGNPFPVVVDNAELGVFNRCKAKRQSVEDRDSLLPLVFLAELRRDPPCEF